MKKKKNVTEKNQADMYYSILKECVDNPIVNTATISIKLGITECDSALNQLENLGLISLNRSGSNLIKLLPQGFSTYLSISSQKQSSEQARKATKLATWALCISIATFVASILFSILSFYK